jgi:putative membrane protein
MKIALAATGAAVALAAAPAMAQPMNNGFLQQAVAMDTAEIQMGQLLQQKSTTAQVRHYGEILVHDHTMSRHQAEDIARGLNITAPEAAPADAAAQIAQLQALSGPAFDHQAKQDAVEDHQQAIAMYQKASHDTHGRAAEHARQTLPMLHKHLTMAQALPG